LFLEVVGRVDDADGRSQRDVVAKAELVQVPRIHQEVPTSIDVPDVVLQIRAPRPELEGRFLVQSVARGEARLDVDFVVVGRA
jgi:hypothetical protein